MKSENYELLKTKTNPNLAIESMIRESKYCTNVTINNIITKVKKKQRYSWVTIEIIESYNIKKIYINYGKNLSNEIKTIHELQIN